MLHISKINGPARGSELVGVVHCIHNPDPVIPRSRLLRRLVPFTPRALVRYRLAGGGGGEQASSYDDSVVTWRGASSLYASLGMRVALAEIDGSCRALSERLWAESILRVASCPVDADLGNPPPPAPARHDADLLSVTRRPAAPPCCVPADALDWLARRILASPPSSL